MNYILYMKTAKNSEILEYISQKTGSTAKEIIDFSAISPPAVFRHLKKLQEKNQIYKLGKPPKVRYYAYINNMRNQSKLALDATNWATSGDQRFATPEQLCQTRDVFQARTDRLITNLKKIITNENLVYLLVAVVGEIGNNSFDHNIGQWRGEPGIFFAVNERGGTISLADRGQGVLATLKRVRPQIQNDAEALKIAFTEIISGRAPEQRGNGLKFVKKVIMENNLRLEFYSGTARAEITASGMTIAPSPANIPGTLARITF